MHLRQRKKDYEIEADGWEKLEAYPPMTTQNHIERMR